MHSCFNLNFNRRRVPPAAGIDHLMELLENEGETWPQSTISGFCRCSTDFERSISLAKALAPAYIRLGGPRGTFYQRTGQDPQDDEGNRNSVLSGKLRDIPDRFMANETLTTTHISVLDACQFLFDAILVTLPRNIRALARSAIITVNLSADGQPPTREPPRTRSLRSFINHPATRLPRPISWPMQHPSRPVAETA